jgi:hypothetical protein
MYRILPIITAALAATTSVAASQQIPSDQYLRYVPLEYPRASRQTEASARLQLFGDRADPAYRDEAPRDGIDDRRHEVLLTLAERFAPYMVLNSYAIPMDFRKFMQQSGSYPLHIDTWNSAAPGSEVVRRGSIDWNRLAEAPCQEPLPPPGTPPADPARMGLSDDCLLRQLILDYHPDRPASAMERAQAFPPERDELRVMYFEFPGYSAAEWKAEYEDPLSGAIREQYRDFLGAFAHPFLAEVPTCAGGAGYELVLQYWLFYPFNDGGNNHVGDWEHVNVVVAPRGHVTCGLDESVMRGVLNGAGLDSSGDDQLVVRRVEYYYHGKVFVLDYASPNVYEPRDRWEAAVALRMRDRAGEDWFWEEIRRRAYRDGDETAINTHPVVFIGADNKGTDQVLSPPGGANRDSHGSFPFPGLYKNIGPAGAAEEIRATFDHQEFFSLPTDEQTARLSRFKRGSAVSLADRDRLLVVPDHERVSDLTLLDAGVRRDWAWLFLPLRFGYPAVESPFAGVVPHVETGNLSVVAPPFNSGWNRTGVTNHYALYDPHKVPRFFPTDWQDELVNSYGWLNLTLPTISLLPPFDLVWRGLFAPLRLPLEARHPKFLPQEDIPFRFFGVGAGVTAHNITPDYLDLIYNTVQFNPLLLALAEYLIDNEIPPDAVALPSEDFANDAWSAQYQVAFFVGKRFTSENTLRHARSALGSDLPFSGVEEPVPIRGDLNMWEYAGSLRYNVATGALQPYLKAGYGLSWYRIENLTVAGDLLSEPNSPWIRKPSVFPFDNLLPNTWHLGAGLELLAIRSQMPSLPGGLDVSLKLDWAMYTHDLGVRLEDLPLRELIDLGVAVEDLPQKRRMWRNAGALMATISF